MTYKLIYNEELIIEFLNLLPNENSDEIILNENIHNN